MRCVIIGSAPIEAYTALRGYIRDTDFVIACDGGWRHCEPLGISPHLLVGDFDSVARPDTAIETVVLPREKDDTDTMYAVNVALSRGYTEYVLLGALGGRIDHSLGNMAILRYLHDRGAHGILADAHGETEYVANGQATVSAEYAYFSVLCAGDTATVSVTGAKYPLDNAVLTASVPLGISNEVAGDTATVCVSDGAVWLIRVKKG